MKIQPDVLIMARHVAGESATFPRFLQAIDSSEGGGPRIITAVNCTTGIKAKTRQDALDVAARTLVHHMSDFIEAHCLDAFIDYFGSKWAPPKAANDPTNLNANFVPNMTAFLHGEDV